MYRIIIIHLHALNFKVTSLMIYACLNLLKLYSTQSKALMIVTLWCSCVNYTYVTNY